MTITPIFVLLMVPSAALAAFMILGLYPYRLWRNHVYLLALAGGITPMFIMLGLFGYCATSECHSVVPIFTLLVGQSVVALALTLDPLSAVVGTTVSVIGACVMVYAVAYMDEGKLSDLRRFFALMNLFLAAMLTMVLAGDSIVFFLGWEMMGLCSFFLIAYNTTSGQAIAAGRKAFIMTRFADAFLLAALLLLFIEARSVRLESLIAAGLEMDMATRTVIAALLLGGALGKSAQVPFHTWLPSAMAGPTPVSALLHSATMVAAGAFLTARFSPIIQASAGVPEVAAVFGVVTAFFGSLVALFQKDVKRLLAYSSISQIGIMMLSIGVGAPEVAIAHFVVHAIFKSLLFLSAGEITHGSPQGTAMESMRGALYRTPLAFITFAAGAASLAALPVITAGWWSKEAVLAAVYSAGPFGVVLAGIALASAVLTGAYALRPVVLGLQDDRYEPGHAAHGQVRVSPRFMHVPLVLLAAGALFGGLLVEPVIHFLRAEPPHAPIFAVLLGILAPLLGAWIALFPQPLVSTLANVFEGKAQPRRDTNGKVEIKRGSQRLTRFAHWLSQGARVDRFYRVVFVLPFARVVRWLNGYRTGIADPVGNLPVLASVRAHDSMVGPLEHDGVDGLWKLLGRGMVRAGDLARKLQTGRARDYGLAMASGFAALLLLAWGTA